MTYFSKNWMQMIPGTQTYAKVLGPDGQIRIQPYGYQHAFAAPDEITRAQWASRAKWLGRGGTVLSFAGAGLDQWVRDSNDPNMATDVKIGRAVTNGASVAAGAWAGGMTGAAIGEAVFPLGGGIVGGAIGAIVGGAVAGGLVDKFNDGLVEIGGEVGDKVGDAVDALGDAANTVKDKAGDILDDLNPF
jgi:hypothetical protein